MFGAEPTTTARPRIRQSDVGERGPESAAVTHDGTTLRLSELTDDGPAVGVSRDEVSTRCEFRDAYDAPGRLIAEITSESDMESHADRALEILRHG